MSATREQRGIMAAHLCDLAGIAARGGDPERCASIGRVMTCVVESGAPLYQSSNSAESYYRAALVIARLSLEEIDASVAAVMRGDHPADSLMGRVAQMRDDALRAAESSPVYTAPWFRHSGAADSLAKVLDLLAPEGRSARTARGGT